MLSPWSLQREVQAYFLGLARAKRCSRIERGQRAYQARMAYVCPFDASTVELVELVDERVGL